MFFLAKGDCDVQVMDENKESKLVTILQPGRHFGEVALIYNILRTASVHAINYCTIAELNS